MESNEIKMNQKLGEVRNYGIVLLLTLLVLNMSTLGALHWIETNDLRAELAGYAETLPIPVKRIGVRDQFGQSGKDTELMAKYGLTAETFIDEAIKLVEFKNK